MTKGMEFINPNLNLNQPVKPEHNLPVLDAADKIYKNIYKDSLTGCYNRNYFEKFKHEHFDPDRDSNRIGLVFVDINNLKTVNDTQGHEAGDALIKDTAIFLKSNFRKNDLVIRLGGDEFVVLCHNYENKPNFENLLLTKINEGLVDHPNKNLAFGVAVYNKNQDFSSLDKTKDRADTRMFQKKREMKIAK